ncbi:hypothetical protein [Streptomyces lancefieldiae]|uniref:Uncharacterized protein n=1 Tax=Streptomyces lancefieldiae TaxID=3075520 RepID=A0ABU3AH31_9ACTN|nr:hypothetical protein [Streptomyces sp. DSM 40712]MDT0608852.1 hypothetical protein [Streptomyces sp. DSM 40712]
MRINEAVAEALDAIGDDADYETARRLLGEAEKALGSGTTTEAAELLNQAITEINEVCPL